jgi:hypothetical protein
MSGKSGKTKYPPRHYTAQQARWAVWNGEVAMTKGGLTAKDLKEVERGVGPQRRTRIVSKKRSRLSKQVYKKNAEKMVPMQFAPPKK